MSAVLEVRPDMDVGITEEDDARRARIERNKLLPAKLKKLLLNTEPWDGGRISEEFGISLNTLHKWASPSYEDRHPHPHPKMLPPGEDPIGTVGDRVRRGRQAGRVLEWALQKGWFYFDPQTGRLVLIGRVHRGGPKRRARTRS